MATSTETLYHQSADGIWRRCSAKSDTTCPLFGTTAGAVHVSKEIAKWNNDRKKAVDSMMAESLVQQPGSLKSLAKETTHAPKVPYGPRPGRKTIIVGFSGKMGAGKDYLAGKVREALSARGAEIDSSSFAAPLKSEMNTIIQRYDEPDATLAKDLDIPEKQIRVMKDFIADDYAEKGKELSAYDRTPGMRSALQYLGTDVRRAVDDQHWVKQYHKNVDQDLDFSFSTDVRFPNEADSIVKNGGIMIRLEPSAETLRQRAIARDGFAYDAKAQAHPSEVALDGYENFNLTLGDGYKVEDVIETVQKMRDERIAVDRAEQVLQRRFTTKDYTDDLFHRAKKAGLVEESIFIQTPQDPTEVSGL